jgi:hypothetical protein
LIGHLVQQGNFSQMNMSILKRLKEIRQKRSKKQEQKEEPKIKKSPPPPDVVNIPQSQEKAKEQIEKPEDSETKKVKEETETKEIKEKKAPKREKIYDVPRFTRCNSVFIQLATGISKEDLTNPEEDEGINLDNSNATDNTDNSIETIEEGAEKKFDVQDSQILSVLSLQAKHITEAKEQKRPVSLHITPPSSAMKNSNSKDGPERIENKKRKSLTIVDPKDPQHPHQVISRREFLDQLRKENRLSFDSREGFNK